MQVKTTLTLIAASLALIGGQAFAQTDRAAVKAEAKAAEKKGDLKAGEGTPGTDANRKDTKDTAKRAEVKAEAKAAEKKGELKAGETTPASKPDAKSDTKRADVKAEAKAAEKKGELKAGEGTPGTDATRAKKP